MADPGQSPPNVSIVIPAKNEASGLEFLLPAIRQYQPAAEILVVDDGSSDGTADVCARNGVNCLRHPYSKGNGAAIKSGARAARGSVLVFMDADGQHDPRDIDSLLDTINAGYDLAIGARQGRRGQASLARWSANKLYSALAGFFVGHPVSDLTSGFRACHARRFLEFLPMLPNGFSYPTTSTMAFYRAGYSVGFVPIAIRPRQDKSDSHIRLFRDGARFLIIIFRIGTLYSPLKLFLPVSLLFFGSGLAYYLYTFLEQGRFTNGSGLLLTAAIIIFLIGLVSEQITQLLYVSSRDV